MDEKPKCRWFTFGLRTLFAVVTITAIFLALARFLIGPPEPRLEAVQPGMTLWHVKGMLNESRLRVQTGGIYPEPTATGSRIVRRATLHYQWPDGTGGIVHFVHDGDDLRVTKVTVLAK